MVNVRFGGMRIEDFEFETASRFLFLAGVERTAIAFEAVTA